ncbi:hypothetical protein EV383_0172 [Pseudonocardia sediminis]|uniref:Uncharacterized protein n=1 Tax=Pseudonocardia sediminis TaxID=1397368 RepID=A0A4Q7URN8_PSEST|nr:hypothetical protein EV383_0172 [Pseudonocardia sediminis]
MLAILGVAAAIAIGFATTGTSPAPVATPVAPPAPSTSQLLAQWRDGGGLQHLTTISGDLTSVGEAASRYDVSGMMSACYSLQNDIESAQAFTPVPDVQVQSSWSAALASGARSAAYCVAGAQQLDPDLINMSTTEMNDMTSHLDDATARLNSINGI